MRSNLVVIVSCLLLLNGAHADTPTKDDGIPQCYYCATPPSVIRDPKVRRVLFPTEEEQRIRGFRFRLPHSYDNDCASPSNFSTLKVQNCRWDYCIKILVDDNDSDPFVLRGCVDVVMPDVDKSDYNATCLKRSMDYRFVSCVCRGSLCNAGARISPTRLFIWVHLIVSLLFFSVQFV